MGGLVVSDESQEVLVYSQGFRSHLGASCMVSKGDLEVVSCGTHKHRPVRWL